MSIPGVGLDERRRMTACHKRIKIREVSTATVSGFHHTELDLDPIASQARSRLGQKLGYRRCESVGKIWGSNSRRFGFVKDAIFGRLWCYQSTGGEHICAICLDKCDADIETMVLKCSHKYHLKCIVPWLEAHSKCPYCRSPV